MLFFSLLFFDSYGMSQEQYFLPIKNTDPISSEFHGKTDEELKEYVFNHWKAWKSNHIPDSYVIERTFFGDAIRAGLNPNSACQGQSIVDLAAEYEDVPLLDLCLSKGGHPAFAYAFTVKMARYLIANGVPITAEQDDKSLLHTRNVLHDVMHPRYEAGLVDLYRREYGVAVNATDEDRYTPLHRLAFYCDQYEDPVSLHDKAHYLLNPWPKLKSPQREYLNDVGKTAFQLVCERFDVGSTGEDLIDRRDQSRANLIRIMNLIAMRRAVLKEEDFVVDPRQDCEECKEADSVLCLPSNVSSPRSVESSPRSSPSLLARLRNSPGRAVQPESPRSSPRPSRRRSSDLSLPTSVLSLSGRRLNESK